MLNLLANRLLSLLHVALTGDAIDRRLFDGICESEWVELQSFSIQQGVSAIAFAGIERSNLSLPIPLLMDWIGQTEYVKSYHDIHLKGTEAVAALVKETGGSMLVLKGLSLASMYPDPKVREFGDLDVFTFDAHDRVNDVVKAHGVDVEFWDKHDVFNYGGVHVEHHSYFVSKNSKAGKRVNERLLEIIARDMGVKVAENVYYPTPEFNAIFLLNHTIGHMSYEGATLKNILDYGLFLMNDGDKVEWSFVRSILEETGWDVGFNALTRVSEIVLGVDFSKYYIGTQKEELALRVLDTVLDTTLHKETEYKLPKRIIKKTQRLFSHRWMYTSGLIPANFWTDCVWGSLKEHIERPEQF